MKQSFYVERMSMEKEDWIAIMFVVLGCILGAIVGGVRQEYASSNSVQECIEMSTTGNLIQWQAEYPYCNVLVHTVDNLGNDVYVPMTIKEYNEYLPSN
jgi:hypothetical protein